MRFRLPLFAALIAGCWVTRTEVQSKINEPLTEPLPTTGTPGTGTPAGTPAGTPSGTPTTCVDEPLGYAVGPSVASGSTSGAGNDEVPSCYDGSVPGTGPDLVYGWTAPGDGCFAIGVTGASFDSVLYVRDGTCDGAEVACNDDRSTTDASSEVGLDATAGRAYAIVVDGHDAGDVGSFDLSIRSVAPIPVDVDLGTSTGPYDGSNVGEDTTLQPSLCGAPSGADVVLSWTAPSTGTWTFYLDPAGTDFDSNLSLWRPCTDADIDCADAYSTFTPFGGELLTLDLFAGETILVRVAGWQPGYVPAEGNFRLTIQ